MSNVKNLSESKREGRIIESANKGSFRANEWNAMDLRGESNAKGFDGEQRYWMREKQGVLQQIGKCEEF